jgi:hypothetical protein
LVPPGPRTVLVKGIPGVLGIARGFHGRLPIRIPLGFERIAINIDDEHCLFTLVGE